MQTIRAYVDTIPARTSALLRIQFSQIGVIFWVAKSLSAIRMSVSNENQTAWLEEGKRHLANLYAQAIECADEGDNIPSSLGIAAAQQMLETFQQAHAPSIGFTVNGEVSLLWINTGDEFRAYVKQDGSAQYLRNKTTVDEPSFKNYLTAVPA